MIGLSLVLNKFVQFSGVTFEVKCVVQFEIISFVYTISISHFLQILICFIKTKLFHHRFDLSRVEISSIELAF